MAFKRLASMIEEWIPDDAYYRKRGSASYIVREVRSVCVCVCVCVCV